MSYSIGIYVKVEGCDKYAVDHKDDAMLAHTHGQPATPTTIGKEFKVYAYRFFSSIENVENVKIKAKFNGATGNYSAILTAFPNEDWPTLNKEYDILKFAFKNGYCYITRTESGHVEVHKEEPLMRSNEIFGHHWGNRGKSIYLFDNIFCFVKWVGSEKSKPMLIKDILDECEVIKNEND